MGFRRVRPLCFRGLALRLGIAAYLAEGADEGGVVGFLLRVGVLGEGEEGLDGSSALGGRRSPALSMMSHSSRRLTLPWMILTRNALMWRWSRAVMRKSRRALLTLALWRYIIRHMSAEERHEPFLEVLGFFCSVRVIAVYYTIIPDGVAVDGDWAHPRLADVARVAVGGAVHGVGDGLGEGGGGRLDCLVGGVDAADDEAEGEAEGEAVGDAVGGARRAAAPCARAVLCVRSVRSAVAAASSRAVRSSAALGRELPRVGGVAARVLGLVPSVVSRRGGGDGLERGQKAGEV